MRIERNTTNSLLLSHVTNEMKKNETARLAFNVIEIAHVQNANITIIHNSHRLNGIQMFERPKKKYEHAILLPFGWMVSGGCNPPHVSAYYLCVFILTPHEKSRSFSIEQQPIFHAQCSRRNQFPKKSIHRNIN